jgi:addiction module HigA family antidote
LGIELIPVPPRGGTGLNPPCRGISPLPQKDSLSAPDAVIFRWLFDVMGVLHIVNPVKPPILRNRLAGMECLNALGGLGLGRPNRPSTVGRFLDPPAGHLFVGAASSRDLKRFGKPSPLEAAPTGGRLGLGLTSAKNRALQRFRKWDNKAAAILPLFRRPRPVQHSYQPAVADLFRLARGRSPEHGIFGLSLKREGCRSSAVRPIDPGEILKEELPEPGLSANALGVPPYGITDILDERHSIASDTALRLARYFGTTPEFWMKLQCA